MPYRGASPALQDLVAGQVDLLCGIDVPTALPFVRSGKIKAYALMQKARWPQAPEIPTIDEAGVPGLHVASWNGLWAPKRTPQPIIAKLAAAVVETLEDTIVRGQLSVRLGQEMPPRDQQDPAGLAAITGPSSTSGCRSLKHRTFSRMNPRRRRISQNKTSC